MFKIDRNRVRKIQVDLSYRNEKHNLNDFSKPINVNTQQSLFTLSRMQESFKLRKSMTFLHL